MYSCGKILSCAQRECLLSQIGVNKGLRCFCSTVLLLFTVGICNGSQLHGQILCCSGMLGLESAIYIPQIPLLETTGFHLVSANERYSSRLKWGSRVEVPLLFSNSCQHHSSTDANYLQIIPAKRAGIKAWFCLTTNIICFLQSYTASLVGNCEIETSENPKKDEEHG